MRISPVLPDQNGCTPGRSDSPGDARDVGRRVVAVDAQVLLLDETMKSSA